MKQPGKTFSITSTNPKMATQGQVTQRYNPALRAVNGYDATTGEMVTSGGLIPKNYVTNNAQPTQRAAPSKDDTANTGNGIPRTAPVAPAKTGLEYEPYDTELEPEAKAPTVVKGQAPKVSDMRMYAAPTDVKYYGESYKQEAQDLANKRQAAYERKVMNEAIRTGNAIPTFGASGKVIAGQTAGELRSKFVDDLQQSKVDLARRSNAPIEQVAAKAKITDSGASGFNSNLTRNTLAQGKIVAQMSFEDYLKKRKEGK